MQKYNEERNEIHLAYRRYLEENKPKLSDVPEKDLNLLKESFMRSFGKLLREVAKWQHIGDLRPIGWISLMFVRSSIKSKEYEFRWDLYDEYRDLFRHAPIFYWCPEELFAVLEKEAASFLEGREKPQTLEQEDFILVTKEVIIADYFAVIEQICQKGMRELLKYDVWENFVKSDNLKVSVENFLSEGCVLYSRESEE